MGNSIAERDFPGNPPIILKKISQGQQLKKKGRLDDGKHTHIFFGLISSVLSDRSKENSLIVKPFPQAFLSVEYYGLWTGQLSSNPFKIYTLPVVVTILSLNILTVGGSSGVKTQGWLVVS